MNLQKKTKLKKRQCQGKKVGKNFHRAKWSEKMQDSKDCYVVKRTNHLYGGGSTTCSIHETAGGAQEKIKQLVVDGHYRKDIYVCCFKLEK